MRGAFTHHHRDPGGHDEAGSWNGVGRSTMLLLTLGVAAVAPGEDLHFGDYGKGDNTFDDD